MTPFRFTQPIPTLCRDGDSVLVLDQTRLPWRSEQRRLRTLDEAAEAIRAMWVRGAPLIGGTAAYGVALALTADPGDDALEYALATLAATRPTAVNLHWALARMAAALRPLTPGARRAAAWDEAAAICADDVRCCAAIGAHGLPLLQAIAAVRGRVRVMTHCNAGWLATMGAGTALAPVYAAHLAGLAVEVTVSETRPRNQGLLTAWELREAGVPHRLIADNAAGLLLARGEIDLVITGADRIAANGDTANKVGTYLKALAAREAGVPFYIAAPHSTLDFGCPDGDAIPIEDRGAAEVCNVRGAGTDGEPAELRLAPDATAAANPAFDVTPARFIAGIITERGIAAADALAALYPEDAQ
ncbi:methylthioribose-1-phosphate isomerase [Azoarcus olearius]|uniref:S-methyl-5-thioribose-1-phosphate isomerase n=1 Tax=Azoarcus sp. (strain BH72) TaxID=418699 RepID=UPI0008061D93|nr:S-methyl-5-thioribose-1-phosphate isomerase [Azoarcus olearius]ANQ86520.1 methylthioribose-1-phosphate isomerase [Azoarcus olearius]